MLPRRCLIVVEVKQPHAAQELNLRVVVVPAFTVQRFGACKVRHKRALQGGRLDARAGVRFRETRHHAVGVVFKASRRKLDHPSSTS